MAGLTSEDLRTFSYLSDIGGTDESFSVPMIYRFLIRFLSPIVRFFLKKKKKNKKKTTKNKNKNKK